MNEVNTGFSSKQQQTNSSRHMLCMVLVLVFIDVAVVVDDVSVLCDLASCQSHVSASSDLSLGSSEAGCGIDVRFSSRTLTSVSCNSD